jgi:phosphoglycerol transferase MdoB-like AlkP superfamily enzyme
MKKRIFCVLKVYWVLVLMFLITKPIFMLVYHRLFVSSGISDYLAVIRHGMPLDLSVAGYLTVIPTLVILSSVWVQENLARNILRWYLNIMSVVLGLIFTSDLVLYHYWGFRLDSTPLFYVDKPSLVFASVEWYEFLGLVVLLLLIIAFFYFAFHYLVRLDVSLGDVRTRWKSALVLLLLLAFLFLPIRGGISVSTMNVGKVYFSDKMSLNQAAINPFFSFFESLSKGDRFDKQYRFMPAAQARKLMACMIDAPAKDVPALFTVKRPNVIIVILESFMSKDIATLGGIPGVAPNLSKISDEGILFTNFYANSFRTDRGVVSVLSGYPAQPTTSIMKYSRKNQSLPSIPKSLRRAGYDLKYYYGGDIDFTNMRAYLIGQGIENIISDKDYPMSQRLSKWGAHDAYLFQKIQNDLKGNLKQPFCKVVQTSSSHEPFDVPTHRLKHPYLNGVNYTDSCLGVFFKALRKSPYWKNTVVVLCPDHAFRYPDGLNNQSVDRYKIPLIFWGGAVKTPVRVDAYGGQIDIAATLLSQLGLPHNDFTFSKNILNSSSPHFGFFDAPDFMGMVTPDNQVVYDNGMKRTVSDVGSSKGKNLPRAKAFLQSLYDDLAKRK